MRSFLILLGVCLWSPIQADEVINARVVSIYRPLEMEARRVQVERKVFIQSDSEADFSEKLVGQKLTVFRLRRVPAQVDMIPANEKVYTLVEEKSLAEPSLPVESSASAKTGLAPLESGRPSGFAEPSKRDKTRIPVYLGAEKSAGDVVTNVEEPPVETAFVKTKVGEIQILSVEGNVAIAAVIKDGIRKADEKHPSVNKVEGSTVSAGDYAEGILKKRVKKKKAKPLSASEKNALRKARDRIRKMNRPKKKRGKYRRKHMQWDY